MSTGKIDLKNRQFRRGFRRGFSGPSLFFEPMTFHRAMSINSSVSAAWAAVDTALRTSMEIERHNIGKTTGKKTTDKKHSKNDRIAAR